MTAWSDAHPSCTVPRWRRGWPRPRVQPASTVTALTARYGYGPVEPGRSESANRLWWDGEAVGYYAEHGHFLGDDDLCWGPEGLREADAGLLGDLTGLRVLEVGSGAAQGARWAAAAGAREVVALDVSLGMLRQAQAISVPVEAVGPERPHPSSAAGPSAAPPLVQADATRLPFADDSFDLAFSAYGAVPFVEDPGAIMREVARVLRRGGRWVFSVTHPIRWAFPDDPGEGGLTVNRSYFDRTPYRELDEAGRLVYAEHHRTVGDRVRDLAAAGFQLDDLVEPEWQPGNANVWGGWSPLRGALLPGTAVFVSHLPG